MPCLALSVRSNSTINNSTMQNILKHSTFLLILCLAACHQDDDCYTANGISGTWQWTKSIGGFGGNTYTPGTENSTRRLAIDDFMFREYRNDTLFFESQYDVEIRPDSAFGTNKFILFENGGQDAYLLDDNKLELIELCADCFSHYYVRK